MLVVMELGIADAIKDFGVSAAAGAAQSLKEEGANVSVTVNLDIPMEDKALLGLAFKEVKEQAKAAADKIDRRWKITQVMFGVAIGLQAMATIVNI